MCIDEGKPMSYDHGIIWLMVRLKCAFTYGVLNNMHI